MEKIRIFIVVLAFLVVCRPALPYNYRETTVINNWANSEDGGIYDGNVYDDPLGELTVKQKREYAYREQHRQKEQDEDEPQMFEDESLEDQNRRERKEWFLDQLKNLQDISTHKKFDIKLTNEASHPEDRHLRSDKTEDTHLQSDKTEEDTHLLPGETEKDRLALIQEEQQQKRQAELKAKKKAEEDTFPKPGQLFEGDIVMTEHLRNHILGKTVKRDGLKDPDRLWPKDEKTGLVRVPYSLHDDIIHNDYSGTLKKERIGKAIKDFNKFSCIRFEPKKDDDKDYIHFIVDKSMCYSTVGRVGGLQKISIGNGCERLGTVEHEMLHSLGFIHEQSRPDRDDYVKVKWANIKPKLIHNFKKYSSYLVQRFTTYDFDSCLHYHNKAFTNDGEDTLVDKADPDRHFGQRVKMSKRDVLELNRLYKCTEPSQEQMDELPYN